MGRCSRMVHGAGVHCMRMGSCEFHLTNDCIGAVCLMSLEIVQPSFGGDGYSRDTWSSVMRIECCQTDSDHFCGFLVPF